MSGNKDQASGRWMVHSLEYWNAGRLERLELWLAELGVVLGRRGGGFGVGKLECWKSLKVSLSYPDGVRSKPDRRQVTLTAAETAVGTRVRGGKGREGKERGGERSEWGREDERRVKKGEGKIREERGGKERT